MNLVPFLALIGVLTANCWAPAQEPKRQKGASVPPAVIPHKFEAKVVGVLDGDTIRVANAEVSVLTIRLEAIDAPEASQEFGKEATNYLSKLLSQKQVTVEWKERDKYQRLLGYVYHEGNLVNRSLVEQGCAWQFTKYNNSAALKALEDTARTNKIGLWAKDSPIAPWDYRDGARPAKVAPKVSDSRAAGPTVKAHQPAKPKVEDVTVYLTKTGKHYHSAGCRHLSKSSIPIPLSRASGYTPCQHCDPPK